MFEKTTDSVWGLLSSPDGNKCATYSFSTKKKVDVFNKASLKDNFGFPMKQLGTLRHNFISFICVHSAAP